MAASNKLLVVHLEERVGGGEKLRMENNLERERGCIMRGRETQRLPNLNIYRRLPQLRPAFVHASIG